MAAKIDAATTGYTPMWRVLDEPASPLATALLDGGSDGMRSLCDVLAKVFAASHDEIETASALLCNHPFSTAA